MQVDLNLVFAALDILIQILLLVLTCSLGSFRTHQPSNVDWV